MTDKQLFQELGGYIERNDLESGFQRASEILSTDSENPNWLFFLGLVQLKQGHPGAALPYFEKARANGEPNPAILNNMGICYQEMLKIDQALECFHEALALTPRDPDILSNLCSISAGQGKHNLAIDWAKKALERDPGNEDALYNSALSYLALGKYKEGWKRYDVSLGNRFRQERHFNSEHNLPRWDGKEVGGEVVVYGEQGIGDEIMFASILPDAMKKARIILECDRRLAPMFKRSFPELAVYPTRWDDQIIWPQNHNIVAKCEAGHLGSLFRSKKEDFPRKKYLVADPERRAAYRAMLGELKGKKVGIAWTGGRTDMERSLRNISLQELTPLLQTEGVEWVSLQWQEGYDYEAYKYMQETGIAINFYNSVTLDKDYDSTAALVAELDLVIGAATSVIELAGALGVPALQLCPKVPTWRVGISGSAHPWYESVTVLRKESDEWTPVIEKARTCMLSLFADQAATTARVA